MAVAEAAPDNQTDSTFDERVARSHLLFPTVFLGIGSPLWLMAMSMTRFPTMSGGVFSPGRVTAMAWIALIVGWLVPAGSGIVYYLLPRLSGTTLRNAGLARIGSPLSILLALAGMVTVAMGLGDGRGPLLLPWWLDLPVMAIATIPLLVTVTTLRARAEEGVYVSVWFVGAAAIWLPMLYAATNIPGEGALDRVLSEVVFQAGFSGLWVVAVGLGGAFYAVVKITGNPLGNRQMARVAFWSLAFASIWAGPARLVLGVTADWLDKIAAVLGLALPAAMLAAAAGIVVSLDRSWDQVKTEPALYAIVSGMGLGVLVAALAGAGGFKAAAATVGFTPFWDGIDHAWLLSVGTLLFAGLIFHALPAITGRRLADPGGALRGIRLTLIGGAGTLLSLTLGGILTGLTWHGASFTTGSFDGIAETWTEGLGVAGVIVGSGLIFAVIGTVGHLMIAFNIFRTMTSGRAIPQEVLKTEVAS